MLVLVLVMPVLASAHGLVTTQSQTVGKYLIEFEYNTLGNILTGDFTLYDVYLLNPATRDGIDFDSAFIRIEKQNGPAMLAGNLAQAADITGYASLSGVLNDPGTYTAEVSFYKDGDTLAESKFNFTVEKDQTYSADGSADQKKTNYFNILLLPVGLVLVAGGVWLFKKTKQ